jgi:hypothetical protein
MSDVAFAVRDDFEVEGGPESRSLVAHRPELREAPRAAEPGPGDCAR